MNMMSNAAPDWPPPQSATAFKDGTTTQGSTGQWFEVKHGQWVRVPYTEATCPGHVAAGWDSKICGICETHIDSLRPDDADDR
jgi:hypothetical protein